MFDCRWYCQIAFTVVISAFKFVKFHQNGTSRHAVVDLVHLLDGEKKIWGTKKIPRLKLEICVSDCQPNSKHICTVTQFFYNLHLPPKLPQQIYLSEHVIPSHRIAALIASNICIKQNDIWMLFTIVTIILDGNKRIIIIIIK